MEYIRVTNGNIEKEHICCAISNNNDVQVSSKKIWLKERFDDGLVFLKANSGANALLNIYPLKMRGIPSPQTAICILTVYGWPALSKDMAIRQNY